MVSVQSVTSNTGFFRGWATGDPIPQGSILNFHSVPVTAGGSSGLLAAKLGTGGSVQIRASAQTGLIINVLGYFQNSPPTPPGAPTVTNPTYAKDAWTDP